MEAAMNNVKEVIRRKAYDFTEALGQSNSETGRMLVVGGSRERREALGCSFNFARKTVLEIFLTAV